MQKLINDLKTAAASMPDAVGLEVTDSGLDTDDAPLVVVERQRIGVESNNPLQLGGSASTDVYLAFPSNRRWEDIELVAGAFVKAYKEVAPATDIDSIELGRGAGDLRLVHLKVETGTALDLDELPSDFRYRKQIG